MKTLILLSLFVTGSALAENLERDFASPSASAKPITWWHWLNGNITKDGITRDLEAMRRAGLGGCYLFNCGGRMPEGDVRFMQPNWLEMMDHTIHEAERLGLKFGVHNCDGFSQSGGPWIKPETSMKELTWTTRDLTGPASFDSVLDKPEMKEDFYQDIAVVAFPLPTGGALAGAKLRGTLPPEELVRLTDSKPQTKAEFPVAETGNTIEFVFSEPCTVRSIICRNTAPHKWEEDFPIQVAASSDGKTFRTISTFTANWDMSGGNTLTVACDETTGTVFRLTFKNPWPVSFGEIELSSAAKAHFAEAKAGRLRSRGHGSEYRHHQAYPGPDRHRALAPGLVVARDSVRVLTKLMGADGRLKWDVPSGRWRIVRVGFTSNGHRVSPATNEGRGLECDKLDATVVRFHLDNYVGKLLERAGPAAGKTLAAVEIDSWECSIQNWTAGFEDRFRERVGYDLLPWLPALLEGWIIDDADRTDRMLWDWRRFLADQFSASYFAEAAKYLKAKGVTYIGESTGRQQYLYDVAYIRNSEVPMGEFWIDQGAGQGVRVDNKVASSLAHVAGRKIVASESYTSGPSFARWQNHPFSLKPEGDRAFCAGVNQFVFHTFAHQPYRATGPGFTFFHWGLNFNRGNTWWDAADAWMAYLTRCNHMLRQGQQVCDVLWFVGEDVPNRIAWRDELRPVLPAGYDFDGCDNTALMEARVENSRIILRSGANYRVLLLPNLATMRLAIAKKVHELIQAGATVLAPRRPTQSPSLNDVGDGDATVRQLTGELTGGTFEELFQRLHLPPDFEPGATTKDAEILYVHRRTDEMEIYFVSNQRNRAENTTPVFRAGNRAPELWDPATGNITRPGMFVPMKDGRAAVPLHLDPNGSIFVVFRGEVPARHAVAIKTTTSAGAATVAAPTPAAGLTTAAGTFTLALWVKPETEIPLPTERQSNIAFQKQNWAVFPPQGQAKFGDGHAGIGIAAGRNGLVVFEHSARYAPAVVTFPANLTERTHVALVYRDGVPTLFVHGREARSGTKGPHVVHALLNAGGERYRGDRSEPQLFDRALTAREIAALANVTPVPSSASPPVELERDHAGNLRARIWEAAPCAVQFNDDTVVELPTPNLPTTVTIEGPWQISFPPSLGAPASATFERLLSWPEHTDPGIRFFSGTATYRTKFQVANRQSPAFLDLGRVEVIAGVSLNGKPRGTLWKPPFRCEVTGLLREGENELEIQVTNLWPNRMIGDAALPDDIQWQSGGKGSVLPARWPEWLLQDQPRPSGRIAFCTRKNVYDKSDPLLPSGLLGPVTVRAVAELLVK